MQRAHAAASEAVARKRGSRFIKELVDTQRVRARNAEGACKGGSAPPADLELGAHDGVVDGRRLLGLHIAHGKLRIRQTTRRRRDVEVDSGADDDEDDVKQREEAGIVANERRRRRRWRRVCRSILPTHDRPLESALAFVMQQARARAVCVHTPKMVA